MTKIQQHAREAHSLSRRRAWGIAALLFFSGWAGLVYQVLWMRQLGLLFGNTSYATSATLAAFFAGLAVGSACLGRYVGRSSHPLRMYAWFEFGIALTALLYFGILQIFYGLYPHVYATMPSRATMGLVKFALALLLVFPPAFFMGGTLPAIGQYLIRTREHFGQRSARLYGLNTLGAALGVGLSAFVMIPAIGFRFSYIVAMGVSVGIGIAAWCLSRGEHAPAVAMRPVQDDDASGRRSQTVFGRRAIYGLSALSGFSVLALEVVWTRMFAQVHENSVYAFAAILAVVLICLAAGAWVSALLARLRVPPLRVLGVLTLAAGIALMLSPMLFMVATDNMKTLSSLEPWADFLARLFGVAFFAIGGVVLVLGVVFPFLMKAVEHHVTHPGHMLGRLLALNTAGSILGALLTGFVLLPSLGMWRTVQVIAVGYLLISMLLPVGRDAAGWACRGAAGLALVLLLTLLVPNTLPALGDDARYRDGRVLETWEGSDCTVAVIEKPNGARIITINSSYVLGSTLAFVNEMNQATIPLYLYPQTESVFFLGMGTGISAGAALHPEFDAIERVIACEIVPEVVEAAKAYIPDELTQGLFSDPRASVLVEDGRHHLAVTRERYDMINADLFLPYRRGAGSLYSLDHYRKAAERLTPGGVYVQWLPLFQLTEREFGIITRTMLEAFPQVSMWRNNFEPGHEIVALIGQDTAAPIVDAGTISKAELRGAVDALRWQDAHPGTTVPHPGTIPFYYAGNVTAARDLFDAYPINTDDRPLIEYLTPKTFRENVDQRIIWFVGPKIADVIDAIVARCPPQQDPVLANRSQANRRLVYAGTAFHRSMIARSMGDMTESQRAWQRFVQEWRRAAE